MAKSNKVYASYYKEFKCIGGACSDSCCIGWNIDIDKTTFKKYFKVQDDEMKKMFQKNLKNNERCTSPEVDYGKVKIKEDNRCPFLDCKNLCVIHSNLGEEYLSNVCTSFPRVTNKIDNKYEMSLDVSCPEAARLILSNEDGITFEKSNDPIERHIISSSVDTNEKELKDSPIKYLKEIRAASIRIIQNRKYSLEERLYILGDFINELEDIDFDNSNKVLSFIREYNGEDSLTYYEKNSMNIIIQRNFFKKMIKILNVYKEALSTQLKSFTEELELGFDFENKEVSREELDKYIKACDEYNQLYIEKHNYIFENYLVNFMYNNLFPFNGEKTLFDGYIMLIMRYSFIRFYLIGRYLNNKKESIENIIETIQVFSKTVEHHSCFLQGALGYIKRKEYDNMEFAKILL